MTRSDLRRREQWVHQQIESALADGESQLSLQARLGMSVRKLRRWLLDREHRVRVRDDLAASLDMLPAVPQRPNFWTPGHRAGGPGADSGRRGVGA